MTPMEAVLESPIVVPSQSLDKEQRKVVASSVIGTTVEYYDFLIYGTASALLFNKLFFPSFDPIVGTIAAFAAHSVGFLARPIGAAIFGHFGDRVGRKAMLSLTLVIMGLGTFLLGCLPTYDQVGVWAPIALVTLRLLQGIGLGGEWGGAVLMVVESVPSRRRGFFASTVQLGYPIGVVASTGAFALVSLLPEAELYAWGWRLPFLASIFFVGIGLFIRLRVHESPAFERLKRQHAVAKLPLVEILTQHPGTFLRAVGLKVSEVGFVNILTVFSIAYVTKHLGLPNSVILNGIMIGALAEIVAIPLAGWLSDRYGRRPLFIVACLFTMAAAFPLFFLFDTRDPVVITITVAVAACIGQGIMFAVGASWMPELFDARLRYSGASLGNSVGAAISGGLTPLIAASLLVWSGGATWPISIYVIVLAGITLATTLTSPETAGKAID